MKLKLGLAAVLLASGAQAFGADYTVDKDHSRLGFKVRHLVGKVDGEFKDFEGTFSFNEKKTADSKVKVTAKAASIDTNNEKRDAHLRGPDFFDTEKFQSLSFESKKVTAEGKGKFKLEGDLSIHGVTKPATFEVEYSGSAKDPWGNIRTGFSAQTKINRKDFGLVWNKALDTGGVMIGDDVSINLEIEAIQKK